MTISKVIGVEIDPIVPVIWIVYVPASDKVLVDIWNCLLSLEYGFVSQVGIDPAVGEVCVDA